MKITLTGSLGHIGRPLTKQLVEEGHQVTVISSPPERQKAIEALGAEAAIGSVEDAEFLTSIFTNADTVYCMVPPNDYFSQNIDPIGYYHNIAQAIVQSGLKRVVYLSSIGAHLDKDSGLILGHHRVENMLKGLPSNISITHLRPTAFYYNLYGFVESIKKEGVIAANYGGEDKVPWVSPIDIASVVAEEIATPLEDRKIRYVASEECTCNEVAGILGEAIGKPDLEWRIIPDEQMQNSLEAVGMPEKVAAGLTEMNASIHNGVLLEDYYRNRPEVFGNTKMTDFAKEFAANFNQE